MFQMDSVTLVGSIAGACLNIEMSSAVKNLEEIQVSHKNERLELLHCKNIILLI
jgi:hypothetical protein